MRKRREQAWERWERTHTFASEHLWFRPLGPNDAEAYLATIDDEVLHWLGWSDKPQARGSREALHQRRGNAPAGCAAELIVHDRTGAPVASYSLTPSGPGEVAAGWWLAAPARGRGLGHESLRAVLDYVHRHAGVPHVRMGTSADNVRARRQIEATGAALIDASAEHTLPNGSVVPARWYVHTDPGRAAEAAAGWGWVPPCAATAVGSGRRIG